MDAAVVPSFRHRPVALIVDADPWSRRVCAATISELGWAQRDCPGEPFVNCPMARGGDPCPLAQEADVILLSATHPEFRELLDAYRRLAPDKGITVVEPPGDGLPTNIGNRVDAVAVDEDTASIAAALDLAQEAGARRAQRTLLG